MKRVGAWFAVSSLVCSLAVVACGDVDGKQPETGGFLDAQAPAPAPEAAAPSAASDASRNAAPSSPNASSAPAPAGAEVRQPDAPSSAVRPTLSAATEPSVALKVPAGQESAIAAALLHRPWTEVSVLLSQSGLPDARRRMYAAVSAAVAGEVERARGFAQGLDKSDELSGRERALVQAAVRGSDVGAVPAASANDSLAAVAIALCLRARDASKALAEQRWAEAARAYSDVLQADASAEWPADRTALQRWSDGVHLAQERHRWNKQGQWPSFDITVKPGDSLTSIRQRAIQSRAGLVICTGLIQRANQLRSEKDLHPGDVLRIPTDRVHMRVDVSTRWVLYMAGDEVVAAWEGGVGKPGQDTVPGDYVVGMKQRNPTWFRPGAAPVPFGSPENLLGTRWLSWQQNGKETHLGFHGTTDPNTVGGAVSSGCVRMRNADVEVLYEILPEKSAVVVRA